MTLRQVLDDLLADPASIQEPRLGVGEAPLQVGDDTIVSGLLTEVVWILKIQRLVRPTYNSGELV